MLLKNCAKLKEVKIPDSIEYIGVNAFKGCTGLKINQKNT